MKSISFIFIPLIFTSAYCNTFIKSSYEACFTPAEKCTPYILNAIAQAKHSIYVQAYSFTDQSILNALKEANIRGIDVKVILDKGQYSNNGKYTSATFLRDAKIPVWIDDKVSIAHNKVMIFDDAKVLTGSFNFTRSANERNAENLLIISDIELAKQYENNWENRKDKSKRLID